MSTFLIKSYIEGIINSFKSVEFTPRHWDCMDAYQIILTIVNATVPKILEQCSDINPWYQDMIKLGELSKELLNTVGMSGLKINSKRKQFGKLLGKLYSHLWI